MIMKTSQLSVESLNKFNTHQKLNIYSPAHQNKFVVPSINDNYLYYYPHPFQILNSTNHHSINYDKSIYSKFKDCGALLKYLRSNSRIKKIFPNVFGRIVKTLHGVTSVLEMIKLIFE